MNEALDTHNTFRKTHHVDELTWNDTLAASAVKWAANCVFEHSGGKLLAGGCAQPGFRGTEPRLVSLTLSAEQTARTCLRPRARRQTRA